MFKRTVSVLCDMKITLLFAIVFNFGISAGGNVGPQKLLLTVYYESQCLDSKGFILNQLLPAMKVLQDHTMLQLVPFGKSKSIQYGEKGFECQHGPSECLGNMVQDCALSLMRHLSDMERLMYVACEMDTEAGAEGSLECVAKAGLRTGQVEKCIRTNKGTELQLESEYLTMLVRPQFIPTVTIDALFDQEVQDYAQHDLMGILCATLRSTRACELHYNALALKHLLAYPIHAHVPIYITSK